MENNNSKDPCAEFGATQKYALVWFIAVIIFGSVLVCKLSKIDHGMYASNAEFYNYKTFKENRRSFATLGTENIDPRSRGDIATADYYLNAAQ